MSRHRRASPHIIPRRLSTQCTPPPPNSRTTVPKWSASRDTQHRRRPANRRPAGRQGSGRRDEGRHDKRPGLAPLLRGAGSLVHPPPTPPARARARAGPSYGPVRALSIPPPHASPIESDMHSRGKYDADMPARARVRQRVTAAAARPRTTRIDEAGPGRPPGLGRVTDMTRKPESRI